MISVHKFGLLPPGLGHQWCLSDQASHHCRCCFGDLLAGDHRCSAVVVVEAGGTVARCDAERWLVALQGYRVFGANGSLIGCVGAAAAYGRCRLELVMF